MKWILANGLRGAVISMTIFAWVADVEACHHRRRGRGHGGCGNGYVNTGYYGGGYNGGGYNKISNGTYGAYGSPVQAGVKAGATANYGAQSNQSVPPPPAP